MIILRGWNDNTEVEMNAVGRWIVVGICLSTGIAGAAEAPSQQAYDFGDYTSQTLVQKAWGAFDQGDYSAVELYTKKCLELYEAEAKRQQATLTSFPSKEQTHTYWALNDVATAYFVLGRAWRAQGRLKEAEVAFNTIRENFSFAQAWDPKGWSWKLALGAEDQLKMIALEEQR